MTPDDHELLSARAAAAVLGETGVAPAQAQVALAAGLAGRPVVIGRMLGYRRLAVEALASLPVLSEDTAPAECRRGMLVLRAPRGIDPRAHWDPAALLGRGWPIATSARWMVKVRSAHDPVPCVVTAGGFVAGGADIVDLGVREGRTVLVTEAPGPWWESVIDHRFATGRGTSWAWWPRQAAEGRIRLEPRRSRLERR